MNLFERLSQRTIIGRIVTKVGFKVKNYFSAMPYVLGYIGRTIKSTFAFISTEKAARKILIMQLLFTFIEALTLVVILSIAVGSAVFLGGYIGLLQVGQTSLIYPIHIIAISELGPILVSFVVTARSATAIATELGGMVTSHQIEGYISFGVDPFDYLVAPRFLGVTLSVFFLCLYFSICGIVGPFIVSIFVNPSLVEGYFSLMLKNCSFSLVLMMMFKSLILGAVISITATYFGFKVERASTEVPVAGINAVSKSFFGIIISDAILIGVSAILGVYSF